MSAPYSESLALWAGLTCAGLLVLSAESSLRVPDVPQRTPSTPLTMVGVPAAQTAAALPPPTFTKLHCSEEELDAPAAADRFRKNWLGTHGRWQFKVIGCEPAAGGAGHSMAVDPESGRHYRLPPNVDLTQLDGAVFEDEALIARSAGRVTRTRGALAISGPAGATCRLADSVRWERGAIEDCRLAHLDRRAARVDCRSGEVPTWSYVFHLATGDSLVFARSDARMSADGRIVAGRFEFAGPANPCPIEATEAVTGLAVIGPAGFDLHDLAAGPGRLPGGVVRVSDGVLRYADDAGETICLSVREAAPQVERIACP